MRAALALMLPVALAGCGHELQGSLTVLLDMKYNTSDLAVQNDEVAVRFWQPVPVRTAADAGAPASAQNLVLKVVNRLDGKPLVVNQKYDLSEVLSDGAQRGQLSRAVFNDPITSFPPILYGQFYVSQTPVTGHSVSGYFYVVFVDGTDEASGRSVYGSFTSKVL